MEKSKYEKKRKRKKVAGIVAASSSAGLAALIIVAFLGRHVGSFTVNLNQENIKLSLSRKLTSEEKSTFLYVEKLPSFQQYTYGSLPKDDVLDDEQYDYYDAPSAIVYDRDDTSKMVSMRYFKYTFYVSNSSDKPAGFDIDFNVLSDNRSTDGTNRSLLDTLHVTIYENAVLTDGTVTHNKKCYAKAPDVPRADENGQLVDKEYLSMSPDDAKKSNKEFLGFAEPFLTDPLKGDVTKLASSNVEYLEAGAYIRYSFICYLEGYDPSEQGRDVPEGASVKLGIKVNGYESKKIK